MSNSQPLPRLPKAARMALLAAAVALLAALGYWVWRPADAGMPAETFTGIAFMTPAAIAEEPPEPTHTAEPEASSPLPLQREDDAGDAQRREIMPDGKVNINWAGEKTLQTLPGIGEKRAEAIVAYREEHGLYLSVDDLLKVHNMTAKVLEGIRDLVTVRYY